MFDAYLMKTFSQVTVRDRCRDWYEKVYMTRRFSIYITNNILKAYAVRKFIY